MPRKRLMRAAPGSAAREKNSGGMAVRTPMSDPRRWSSASIAGSTGGNARIVSRSATPASHSSANGRSRLVLRCSDPLRSLRTLPSTFHALAAPENGAAIFPVPLDPSNREGTLVAFG